MSPDPLNLLNFSSTHKLPMIRQNEITECGNACLAMIAGFYGFKTDIAALRRRFPASAQGMTLRMLSENASRLGFSTRALKVELDQLNKLRLPAIIHWDFNHFVVLYSFKRGTAIVHDPAKGVCTYNANELSNHYTGIALELLPTSTFEKQDERQRLKLASLWSSLRGLGPAIIQVLLLSVVIQAYVLAAPQYLQLVVDTILPTFDKGLLNVLAIGFGLFLIINILAEVIRGLVLLYAGNLMAYQVSINLFTHLMRLPLSFFERRHIGDIVSRFSSIDPIEDFLTQGVTSGIIDGVMALLTLALMFFYSPLLAMVSLAALALYLLVRLAMFRSYRAASEELIVTDAAEKTNFMETVRGIQTVKSFTLERDRQSRWQNLLADNTNQRVRVERLGIVFESASGVIRGLEYVLVLYLAARMVLEANLTIGMIFAFIAYRDQFVSKATNLVELLIQFRMLDLHLERISDIAIAEEEAYGSQSLRVVQGHLDLSGVSFEYERHLTPILRNVDLKINAGESIALVGPSGAGKTTLVKLMMGLLMPTKGDVLIDGIPIRSLSPNSYRRQMASVMQADKLFAGSLAENIAFFDTEVDIERVHASAKSACIHDEIVAMHMGYETPVGDMGSTLSGGQFQRVLLARALYQQPRILIMDEGTSNLDIETEQAVNQAVERLGITRIIVAHRPQTIAMADRVIELRDGILTERVQASR